MLLLFIKNSHEIYNHFCRDHTNTFFGFYGPSIFILNFQEIKDMNSLMAQHEDLQKNEDISTYYIKSKTES